MGPLRLYALFQCPPCTCYKPGLMVGALQYVTLSRPDITFVVNKVCQFMHSLTENHWSVVKWILRYLQGTSHYGLVIQHKSSSILYAYTDAHFINAFSDVDWAGCPDECRSTGRYVIYLGNNLISQSLPIFMNTSHQYPILSLTGRISYL